MISLKEAEQLIQDQHKFHDHFHEKESKNRKKTAKLSRKSKKIRKK